ncbi:MAG: hypothetical protein GY810_29685 [Aureispira sp.]|nr:hypothetical protein [Aureispira sp.]
MEGWKELVKTVLLGTSTQRKDSIAVQQELKQYGVEAVDSSDRENNTLRALAAYTQLNKAGLTTDSLKNKLLYSSCPSEKKEVCSHKARLQLQHILQNNYEEILIELLKILDIQQQHIPHQLLPNLLTYGTIHKNVRPYLVPCLGERGVWLSQFNPHWNYVHRILATNDERIFELGSKDERLEYLENLRRLQPQKALQLIEKSWSSEAHAIRVSFLNVLYLNLSYDDEAFLEKCLKDRRKEVREKAVELLSHLPHAALIGRVQKLLEDAVQYNPQKRQVSLFLPEHCTTEMKENGVRVRYKPLPAEGQKANWLAQLMALTPPSYWSKQWDKTPEELLKEVAQTNWHSILIWAWATAAQRFQDHNWILACHRFYVDTQYNKRWTSLSIEFMYEGMSDEVFNTIALEYLTDSHSQSLSDDHPIVNFLLREDQQWNEELSKKVIHRIKYTIAQDSYVFHWALKSVLKRAAYAVPAGLYPVLNQNWPESSKSWHSWQMEVNNFLSILRFRGEVLNVHQGNDTL